MATPAQIIANAANAQHSTGSTTPEGKTRSAANSTKLGFHAKQAVLLTDDAYQVFDALSTAFRFELHPTGNAQSHWRLPNARREYFPQIPQGTTGLPIRPSARRTYPAERSQMGNEERTQTRRVQVQTAALRAARAETRPR